MHVGSVRQVGLYLTTILGNLGVTPNHGAGSIGFGVGGAPVSAEEAQKTHQQFDKVPTSSQTSALLLPLCMHACVYV